MDTRRRRALLTLSALVGVALTGCGQKGPLYLPQEKLDEIKKKRQLSALDPAKETPNIT